MLMKAGFMIRQNGDEEGSATFNPADPVQAKLALRVVKIRVRRVLSSAETEARSRRMGQLNARRHGSSELTSRMGV
jgi:curli biogenesis system outer membrane secretion channel CsgG